MTEWHNSFSQRNAGGKRHEDLFASQVRCHCGGKFVFIGSIQAGFPDFTCDNCGQLVDVKSSPQIEQTGNIAVSEIPWGHYADDVLIATMLKGQWVGGYRARLKATTARPSTHRDRATRFVLVPVRQMVALKSLGYRI